MSFNKKIILNYRGHIAVLILVVVAVFTHWQWFIYAYQFGWGDGLFFARSNFSWESYLTVPLVWDSYRSNGLGGYNIVLSLYPAYFLIAVLAKLGIILPIVEKLVVLWIAAIAPTITSYLLVKKITKSVWGAACGSIVYGYNVYILLTQAGGQLTIGIAYALVPLGLYLFIKSLTERRVNLVIFTALTWFIISTYEFRIYYINLIINGALFLYLCLKDLTDGRFRRFFDSVIIFGSELFVWFLFSQFWILPLINSGAITRNEAINRGLFGNQYMNFKQSLLFFQPFWTGGNGQALGVVQKIPEYFIFIPVLAILGAIANFRRPLFKFFILVAVLGIILTKQTAPPFPDLYLWLYNHFPGFNAYRESSKFYLLLALGYSVLIGGFISSIRRLATKIMLFIFVAILFLFNTLSIIDGRMGLMFFPKPIPEPYEKFEKVVHTDYIPYRTLWVPAISMWSYQSLFHPRVGLYQLYFGNQSLVELTKDISFPNLKRDISINDNIFKLFLLSNAQQIFSEFGIRYVVVPFEEAKEIFETYGLTRLEIVNFLDSVQYLEKKPIVSGLDIYENKDYLPIVSVKNYQMVDSTNIKIFPPYPNVVKFSQTYDSNWALMDGEKIISKATRTDLGLMQFEIPKEVKDKQLEIYFLPQRYAQIGTTISISVAIATTIYFSVVFIKSRRHD